jgi:hypothetical protein
MRKLMSCRASTGPERPSNVLRTFSKRISIEKEWRRFRVLSWHCWQLHDKDATQQPQTVGTIMAKRPLNPVNLAHPLPAETRRVCAVMRDSATACRVRLLCLVRPLISSCAFHFPASASCIFFVLIDFFTFLIVL